ncbi:hypothetical protein [Streptomyces sp. WAC01280]|uniref:hypothetical protein n=1 Tax=Streptomyces sp. WAC01280 TaxID=2487424 RepID=UPI000F76F435|nr:hypothetical protein [Streptomyces sp. WAC01280]RSS52553.1 hypothetical protein EF909_29765 [Streptomyces sp. WAC01280]
MGVTFQAQVGPNPSQYYGTIAISNIAQDNGSPVTMEKHLKVDLTAPVSLHGSDVNVALNPWQEIEASTENTQIGSERFAITLKLAPVSAHTFNPSDTITLGVNGDLTGDAAKLYLESIKISTDD